LSAPATRLLLAAAVLSATNAFAAKTRHFRSPSGRIDVAFTEVGRRTDPPDQFGGDHVAEVEYRIAISSAGNGAAIASAAYVDAFSDAAQPAPVEELFRAILWSPREDLLVLPAERRPGSSETAERLAFNLTARPAWKKAAFALEDVRWLDPLAAVGDRKGGCRSGVYLFDGRDGTTRALKEPRSPAGYALVAVSGDSALIRKFPDDCATDDLRFPESCTTLDLKTLKEAPAACIQ
jgi:hypothetical protein